MRFLPSDATGENRFLTERKNEFTKKKIDTNNKVVYTLKNSKDKECKSENIESCVLPKWFLASPLL